MADKIDIVIHPTYRVALDLHDGLVSSLVDFNRRKGLLIDLPDSIQDFQSYRDRLAVLQDDLRTTPQGHAGATNFEQLVGDVLRLCLFRPLHNIAEQARDVDGVIRRDWVASNRANSGFWEVMRQRYAATQVVFECKNYAEVGAADFQQAAYYMTKASGLLVFIVFRGEVTKQHMLHVKRVHVEKEGLVMLLTERDLGVFIRQSMVGKVKDDHLQAKYDETVRSIS
ncbi:MAG: hypothetical protein ACQEXM_20245 [Actinomycetota bacterium]